MVFTWLAFDFLSHHNLNRAIGANYLNGLIWNSFNVQIQQCASIALHRRMEKNTTQSIQSCNDAICSSKKRNTHTHREKERRRKSMQ